MAYRITRSGRGKSFEYYLELPAEVRMVINDEMDPDDMCRFTRCSRLCNEEVKKSHKYIYGLTFDCSSEQNLTVTVNHAHFYYQYDYEYRVVFQTDSDKKCMKYLKPAGSTWTELWKVDVDRSIDLVQLASGYFKNLLEFYQNSIKLLRIIGEWNYDVEVRNLNNLRILDLKNCVGNIMEVISKRKQPLNYFDYRGEMDEKLLEDDEFIYQVRNNLTVPELKLNIEQFRRLSAGTVIIHIGEITPNDIFNLITSWKNGQLRENFRGGFWELDDSDFDAEQLWQLLKVESDDSQMSIFRIDHNLEPGRFATLHHLDNRDKRLAFRVSSQLIL